MHAVEVSVGEPPQHVLRAIADGTGPSRYVAALGYAGWQAGQLESEIAQLRRENRRLAELELRMDALLRNPDSSSQTPPATDSN